MEWKTIQGYENYEVSNEGQVRNKKTGRILKPWNNKGYFQVKILKKWFYIHRLVAVAFIPNPDNLPEVDHINKNSQDNKVENLQWISRENHIQKDLTKKVYCIELEQTFDSIQEAEEFTGAKGIIKVCKGIRKTSGGYHWEYVD